MGHTSMSQFWMQWTDVCYMYFWCQLSHVMISFGGCLEEGLPCLTHKKINFETVRRLFTAKINLGPSLVFSSIAEVRQCAVHSLAESHVSPTEAAQSDVGNGAIESRNKAVAAGLQDA